MAKRTKQPASLTHQAEQIQQFGIKSLLRFATFVQKSERLPKEKLLLPQRGPSIPELLKHCLDASRTAACSMAKAVQMLF